MKKENSQNTVSAITSVKRTGCLRSRKTLPVVAETPICVPNKSKNEAFMEADTVASIDMDSSMEFE